MKSLFDYLKYNNIPYSELKNEGEKSKLEKFVDCIKKVGLEQEILAYPESHHFNIRWFEHNGRDFVSTFHNQPLVDKMIVLWLKLDEKEPVEEYRKIFPI